MVQSLAPAGMVGRVIAINNTTKILIDVILENFLIAVNNTTKILIDVILENFLIWHQLEF
jgi:hypothetical protein